MAKKITLENIDRLFEYDLDTDTRTIYMGSVLSSIDEGESGVDAFMAERMIKALHVLEQKGEGPVTIIMNNPGGDEYHGMAIYDAMKCCNVESITVKAYGHCMSMGSWIIQAADTRLLSPDCTMMLHYGEAGFRGHSKNLERYGEEVKRTNQKMEDVYLERIKEKHSDFTRSKLQKMIAYDKWITAKEAVELGLADDVLETVR